MSKETKKESKTAEQLRKEQAIHEAELKIKQEDFKKRVAPFIKEFEALVIKYKIGLGAKPVFITHKDPSVGYTIGAQPIWIDAIDAPELKEKEKEQGSEVTPS